MLLCMSQQVLLLPSAFLSIHLLSMRETELADESRRVEIFSWYEAMSLHSLPHALLISNSEEKISVQAELGERQTGYRAKVTVSE